MSKTADTPYGNEVQVPIVDSDTPGIVPATNATTATITIADGGPAVTNVFVAGKPALAIALVGDAWPRYVIMANATDGIYMGDGQSDPTAESGVACNIFQNSGGFGLFSTGNVALDATGQVNITSENGQVIIGLPTIDPHINGALWNNAGVVNVSAG